MSYAGWIIAMVLLSLFIAIVAHDNDVCIADIRWAWLRRVVIVLYAPFALTLMLAFVIVESFERDGEMRSAWRRLRGAWRGNE